MKLHGNIIEARYTKVISFTRDPEPIKFTLQSFIDDTDLDKRHPRPEPKMLTRPGKEPEPDTNDTDYQKTLDEWGGQRVHYMAIKTIQDVEWETVKENDPTTWCNWEKEMRESGFSMNEVLKMQSQIFIVNGLTDEAVTDATKN